MRAPRGRLGLTAIGVASLVGGTLALSSSSRLRELAPLPASPRELSSSLARRPSARPTEAPSVATPSGGASRVSSASSTRVRRGRGANLVLTFDDAAWERDRVKALLGLLERLGVEAMFFGVGEWLERRPAFVERAVADGHAVCNHTYRHRALDGELSLEERRREIERGGHHHRCRLLRPPFMAYDADTIRVARELGYEIFLWDIDSRDLQLESPEPIIANVLAEARPGATVLFHLQSPHLLAVLPPVIERLQRAGYRLTFRPDRVAKGRFSLGRRGTWAAARTDLRRCASGDVLCTIARGAFIVRPAPAPVEESRRLLHALLFERPRIEASRRPAPSR